MLLPPRYSTERTLHRTQQEREGRRKGGRKGGICLAGMNPLHPLLLLSPFLPHTHERGEGGFVVVAFLLSFVESRRLNLPPRCQKKSDGGSWLPGGAVKVWRQRGRFLLSLFLVATNFCKDDYCLPTDVGGSGGGISIQSPSSGFFFLSRSRKENLPGCLSCFSFFFCVASRESALRESVRKDIGGKMQLGSLDGKTAIAIAPAQQFLREREVYLVLKTYF